MKTESQLIMIEANKIRNERAGMNIDPDRARDEAIDRVISEIQAEESKE